MESGPSRSAMNRSPRPSGRVASMHKHTTSTSSAASAAVAFSRSPSAVRGLWMPGVSTNTTCTSSRCSTPRTAWRVVWALSETMATLVPTMALIRVDLPELGRPNSVTNPDRKPSHGFWPPESPTASSVGVSSGLATPTRVPLNCRCPALAARVP